MKNKTSPVYVAVFLYRFAFVLFAVPLQAVIFEGTSPQKAIYVYRLDIAFLIFLFVWAVVCFRSISYSTGNSSLLVEKGVLISQHSKTSIRTFDSLHITENFIFRLFKVCKIQTLSSTHKTTLYLKRKDAYSLSDFFKKDKEYDAKNICSSLFSTLVFSAGFSGALTGLLSVSPLLRNIAGIIGESNTRGILSSADLWYFLGYTALPPFLRTLSTIFIWAWAVGTFAQLNRYLCLRAGFSDNCLVTSHGFFTKHLTVLRKNAISALVLKKSILLYFLGLYTVQICLPSDKKETRIPLLLASKKERCRHLVSLLGFPHISTCPSPIKPPANVLWSYVWKPVLFLFFVSFFCISVDSLTHYKVEIHITLFLYLWGCAWFLLCAMSHKYSALFIGKSGLVISTDENLSFLHVHIPFDKIRTIKVTENIFQKRKGVCNLRVYIRSNRRQSFLIKHIDKNKTAQLTKM